MGTGECGQLQALISQSCVCKTCGGSVEIVEDYDTRKGWCSKIALKCAKCSDSLNYVSTSPVQGGVSDINTHCVLAKGSIGCGRSGAHRFSAIHEYAKSYC